MLPLLNLYMNLLNDTELKSLTNIKTYEHIFFFFFFLDFF